MGRTQQQQQPPGLCATLMSPCCRLFHCPCAEAGQYLFVVLFLGSLFPRCGGCLRLPASCLDSIINTHRLFAIGHLPEPPPPHTHTHVPPNTPVTAAAVSSTCCCRLSTSGQAAAADRLAALYLWLTCIMVTTPGMHQEGPPQASTTLADTHLLPRSATVKPHHTPAHLPVSALLPCPPCLS